MKSELYFSMLLTGCFALVLIVIAGCLYQYNDGVTALRRQAVERGCSVTPSGNDYIFDCKHQ